MNKETDIIIRTPVGNTGNIQVKEVVKQDTILRPIMCCAETSTIKQPVKQNTTKRHKQLQGWKRKRR